MAAGSSSQQNFRKAIGAIKDTTLVGLAKVNSEYKDLNVSILKATNHVEVLPKEKHVRIILRAVSGSRPRADVSFCIHALARRLAKTRTWVVALKTLIVIHRALREVDHSFCEELINHNKGRGHLLNLSHFKDDSTPSAWDYSAWIRTYALYIDECLACFRVLKYDLHRDHSRTKKLDTAASLEQLPALQSLLFRLLGCEPVGVARYNYLIQYALSIIAAESVRLYVAITDGVLTLVDKYFEMPCRDAVKALEIYRKSGAQAHRLSEFFEMCRTLEFGRRQKYVKIQQPPASFLQAMEEYIKEAPQTLTLPGKSVRINAEFDENDEVPKMNAAVPADDLENEEKSDPSDECTETSKSDKDAVPLIPDLLSWDELSEEGSDSDETNSLSHALDGPGVFDPTINSEQPSEPASWELALVSTPTSSVVELNKGGVLDRSLLDSLYDAALTQTSTNGPYQMGQAITNGPYQPANNPSNPFESDAFDHHHPQTFYNPGLAANPNYMHLAEIPQQQAPFMQQQQDHQPTHPIIGYDNMQMVGINPQHQQQELSIISYDFNQEQPQLLFVGQEFTQMNDALQQQESTVVGPVDSTSTTSRNPFDDYKPSPLPGSPKTTQSSSFSFFE